MGKIGGQNAGQASDMCGVIHTLPCRFSIFLCGCKQPKSIHQFNLGCKGKQKNDAQRILSIVFDILILLLV